MPHLVMEAQHSATVVARIGRSLALFSVLGFACGCSSARRLDPEAAIASYSLSMRFRFEPGVTDPGFLAQIAPGDILAFRDEDDAGGFWAALKSGLSRRCQVAIAIPYPRGEVRVLSSDSEQGAFIESVQGASASRPFAVYTYGEPGLLDPRRLTIFADRVLLLGRLDYDWSALFWMGSTVTPNTISEIGDEYTDAACVAAALHFAGLSLDRAAGGIVSPGDVVYSVARRNLNGPRTSPSRRGRAADRDGF